MRPAVKSKTAPIPARWIYVPAGVHQPDLALELRDLVAPRTFVDAAIYERGRSGASADRAHAAAALRRGWVGTCLDRLPDHDGYCAAGTGQHPRRFND